MLCICKGPFSPLCELKPLTSDDRLLSRLSFFFYWSRLILSIVYWTFVAWVEFMVDPLTCSISLSVSYWYWSFRIFVNVALFVTWLLLDFWTTSDWYFKLDSSLLDSAISFCSCVGLLSDTFLIFYSNYYWGVGNFSSSGTVEIMLASRWSSILLCDLVLMISFLLDMMSVIDSEIIELLFTVYPNCIDVLVNDLWSSVENLERVLLDF